MSGIVKRLREHPTQSHLRKYLDDAADRIEALEAALLRALREARRKSAIRAETAATNDPKTSEQSK